jgi:autotransporter-associated beta strand protein
VILALIAVLCGLCLIPAAASPPSGYYQVWGDDFSGSSLDTTKWDYWENNETWGKAYNTASAVSVSNGHMVITTSTSGGTTYTAMVASDYHFRPRYGYYEASIKWGDYSGMWSAFWLRSPTMGTYLDDSFVSGAELDVCEHRYVGIYGTNIANIVSDNIHWNGYGSQEQSSGSPNVGTGLATGFHTYSLLWTLNSYVFGIDGSTAWNGSSVTPPFGSDAYVILSSQVDDGTDVGVPPWAGYIPSGGYPTGTNQLIVDYFYYYAPTNVLFWSGTNSAYWTNSANWVAGMSPLATSDLTFSYLMATPSSILGSNYTVDGLIFLGMTNSPTIGGTNTLTLGAGGIDMVATDQNVALNAPISLGANQTWTVGRNNPGNVLALNGSLAGTTTLTKAGYGTLILNGTNSFTGVLNVDTGSSSTNDGVLLITRSEAVANAASPISIRNTGTGLSTLQLSNSVTVLQTISLAGRNTNVAAIEVVSGAGNTLVGGLTLAGGGSNYLVQCDAGTLDVPGTISAGSTATGARALTLQGAGNFSISGSIQNGSAAPLSLVKTNQGSLTLSGANTFTGTTTNWAGNLFINGSLAGPLVFNGSILAGTGLVTGDTSVQGGEISPGSAVANSIGTLSFGGNLMLGPRVLAVMEINAAPQTNDQLKVAGRLTFGGSLYVGNLAGTLTSGQTFQLFNAGGYAGSFPTATLPTLAAGLVWDTSRMALDGTISVATLPLATISPVTTNAECASTILLTGLAGGTPPFTYQWFDTQTNAIAGATNAALTLSSVRSAQAGNYTLLVANNVGNASAIASVTVTDTTPPVISLNGPNPMTVECHSTIVDPGATALDACAGPVAVVTTGSVNPNVAGTYTLTYTANDGNGNIASTNRTVNVVDTTATLSITELGGGQLQLNWNSGTLQGATNASGPYDDILGAAAPYIIPGTNAQQYYRLR